MTLKFYIDWNLTTLTLLRKELETQQTATQGTGFMTKPLNLELDIVIDIILLVRLVSKPFTSSNWYPYLSHSRLSRISDSKATTICRK